MDEAGLVKWDRGFETAAGDDFLDFGGWADGDVAAVGGADVLNLFGGDAVAAHGSGPGFQKALIFGGVEIGGEIGADEGAAGMETGGDVAEELGAGPVVQDELGDEEGGGGVVGGFRREGVDEAGVEGAAGGHAGVLRALPKDVEHGGGGFDGGEVPGGMQLGEVEYLGAGAAADAENTGIGWKGGKDGVREEVEGCVDRGETAPLLIVGGGLLIEDGGDFFLMHGTILPQFREVARIFAGEVMRQPNLCHRGTGSVWHRGNWGLCGSGLMAQHQRDQAEGNEKHDGWLWYGLNLKSVDISKVTATIYLSGSVGDENLA